MIDTQIDTQQSFLAKKLCDKSVLAEVLDSIYTDEWWIRERDEPYGKRSFDSENRQW